MPASSIIVANPIPASVSRLTQRASSRGASPIHGAPTRPPRTRTVPRKNGRVSLAVVPVRAFLGFGKSKEEKAIEEFAASDLGKRALEHASKGGGLASMLEFGKKELEVIPTDSTIIDAKTRVLCATLINNVVDVPIINDTWSMDSARYGLELNFNYSGNFVGSGVTTTIAESFIAIDGAITEADGLLVMSNIGLQPITVSVPPESLPAGVNSIDLVIQADLGALIYSGIYETADIDGDGQVCGSDLAQLLGNWGSAGTGDLDGDGQVGGSDLTLLLSAWNC